MSGGYDLIALDMDGTVLNDRKEITPGVSDAITQALLAGKEVVFCSGRAHVEMLRFLNRFPKMHYLIAESGAYVYDLWEKKIIFRERIGQEELEMVFAAVEGRDVMPVVFSDGRYVANRSQIQRLADYGMAPYAAESPKLADVTDDLRDLVLNGHIPVEKLNVFHPSPEERKKTAENLEKREPRIEMVYSEGTSLEFSPCGIHKGTGLKVISDLCHIPPERMIMTGDADNDLPAMCFAGKAIAMGNANARVRAVCDTVVADNQHDGCAEAIRKYLLEELPGI